MLDLYSISFVYTYMRNKGNTMNTHDVELFDMTTITWRFPRYWMSCSTNDRLADKKTPKWKKDKTIDKVFVKLAKKLENNA